MNVLLLGGSNTGLHFGWAAHLARLAEGRHQVENRFLGAVGATFAVVRLLQLASETDSRPDLVIVEYLLNDIIIRRHTGVDPDILPDALAAIAEFCARERIRLLVLGLVPRYMPREWALQKTRGVVRTYRSVLRRHGVAPMVIPDDILGRKIVEGDYVDENHIGAEVSERIALGLLDLIDGGHPTIPKGRTGWVGAFSYVDAARAETSGRARLIHLETPVLRAPFIEMRRPSGSRWPGRGRVVGLVLRCPKTTGTYAIAAGARAIRKNAHTLNTIYMSRPVLFHFLQVRMLAEDDLDVSLGQDGDVALPFDETYLESPSDTPLADQILDISGILFWRPHRWTVRLKDRVRETAFAVLARAAPRRAATTFGGLR